MHMYKYKNHNKYLCKQYATKTTYNKSQQLQQPSAVCSRQPEHRLWRPEREAMTNI